MYEDYPDNPHDIVGTIRKIVSNHEDGYEDGTILVDWDNGESNSYDEFDLEIEKPNRKEYEQVTHFNILK